MKKNGVTTATLKIDFNIVEAESPTNSCGCRFATSPVTTEDAIRRIPTPPMITVSTVCNTAAVFAPRTLITVMKMDTRIATASLLPPLCLIPAGSGSCLLQQLPQISDQICQFPLRPISRLTEVLSGNLTDLFQMVGDGIPVEEAASRQIPVLLLAHV